MKLQCVLATVLLTGCGLTPTERLQSFQPEQKIVSEQAQRLETSAATTSARLPLDRPPRTARHVRKKVIVFLGDSTTHFWLDYPWFKEMVLAGHFIEKGVGGDTTAGMLARFEADVIAHKPDVVVILGGANDGHRFQYQEWQSQENLRQMYERAKAAGLRVVACTIMPVRTQNFAWANPSINRKNDWIRAYGKAHPEVTVLDYWALVLDPVTGELRADIAYDNVHMKPSGYALLHPVTDAALRPYLIPDLAPAP